MEQDTAKKWFKKCIGMLLGLLALVAIIVVIVDPYFHYHKPLSFLSYRLYEERYVNDGISRHFDYDAIITGTSMAQNFKPSEMDALFGTRAIKAPFSGAGYQELSQNLERALSRNQELKTVLWAVDYNGLLREYDWQQYEEYPTYLYDENPFNDIRYVFNKSIFYHGVLSNIVLSLQGSPSTTLDEYSAWEKETGLAHIMYTYQRSRLQIPDSTEFGIEQQEAVKRTVQNNIVNLVSRYPDTEFILFYTPYSICFWDAQAVRGTVLQQIEAEKTATEMLLQCPNVKLYNFFDQFDVICNTSYYNDESHYSAEINSKILEWISLGTGLLTSENYLQRLEEEREFYLNFDYDSIYLELEEDQ